MAIGDVNDFELMGDSIYGHERFEIPDHWPFAYSAFGGLAFEFQVRFSIYELWRWLLAMAIGGMNDFQLVGDSYGYWR